MASTMRSGIEGACVVVCTRSIFVLALILMFLYIEIYIQEFLYHIYIADQEWAARKSTSKHIHNGNASHYNQCHDGQYGDYIHLCNNKKHQNMDIMQKKQNGSHQAARHLPRNWRFICAQSLTDKQTNQVIIGNGGKDTVHDFIFIQEDGQVTGVGTDF